MRKLLGTLAVLGTALSVLPAFAGSGKIAVLPAVVVKGASANGPVVTEAVRASLKKEGFTLTSADQVKSATSGMDFTKIQTVGNLAALRGKLGADYLVYTRVLSVGKGVNTDEGQANILVNVIGKSTTGFAHTRQIGQTFALKGVELDRALLPRSGADEAADKLLEQFYAKQR
ncbi:MAG: hypothetical protein K0Q72_2036 [Armatimonadetes bacterium]|jgi:hypothetical protein|nr:hypothetical protein [Armatimonadota bacterium]